MPPKRVSPRGQAAPTPQPDPVPAPAAPKKPRQPRKAADASSKNYYVRNIRGTSCRCTLFDGTRIFLEPRGQRGDAYPITADQANDPILIQNIGMLFEVISDELGREILMKQATNQQVGPTPFDMLVNEKGDKLIVNRNAQPTFENQGQVVAQIQQAPDGKYSENNTELVRAPGAAPVQQQVPGSNLSPAEYADFLARQNSEASADALRGQFNVSINPAQQG